MPVCDLSLPPCSPPPSPSLPPFPPCCLPLPSRNGRSLHFQWEMINCWLSFHPIRYAEAERMLAGNMLTKPKSCEEIEAEFGGMACHVFSLLGQLYRWVPLLFIWTPSYHFVCLNLPVYWLINIWAMCLCCWHCVCYQTVCVLLSSFSLFCAGLGDGMKLPVAVLIRSRSISETLNWDLTHWMSDLHVNSFVRKCI